MKNIFENKHSVPDVSTTFPSYDMEFLRALNDEFRSKPIQSSFPSYDDDYQFAQAERRIQHLQTLTTLSGKRILEIGCGGGYTSYTIAKNFNCSITGTDIYQSNIWDRLKCENIDFLCVDHAKENPFKVESFDLIISYVAWEHMRHPFEVLQQSAKLLKHGIGQLFIIANLYRSAIASHLYRNIFFPWPHLLFDDELLIKYALEQGVEQWWIDAFYFVNKLTYPEYKNYFSILDLGIVSEKIQKRNVDLEFYERFEKKLGLYPISDLEMDFFEVLLVKGQKKIVERRSMLLSNVKILTNMEIFLCDMPIHLTIKATGIGLKFCWYVFLNDEKILTTKFSDSPDLVYLPITAGRYVFKCFGRDNLDNRKSVESTPISVVDS